MLKEKGYTTGHFGKWHLGTLNKEMSAKGANAATEWKTLPRRGSATTMFRLLPNRRFAPGTPALGNDQKTIPFYENGVALDGNDESLKGGAARVVVDRAVPFIEKAAADKKPFLAVVWFHAPHEDIEAGPDYLKMYEGHGEAAHFYGCITELDEQVGRIYETLEKTGTADNTLIFFCSDNGPEG